MHFVYEESLHELPKPIRWHMSRFRENRRFTVGANHMRSYFWISATHIHLAQINDDWYLKYLISIQIRRTIREPARRMRTCYITHTYIYRTQRGKSYTTFFLLRKAKNVLKSQDRFYSQTFSVFSWALHIWKVNCATVVHRRSLCIHLSLLNYRRSKISFHLYSHFMERIRDWQCIHVSISHPNQIKT
jgi:hypothetical protein